MREMREIVEGAMGELSPSVRERLAAFQIELARPQIVQNLDNLSASHEGAADEIAADSQGWQELRNELSTGLFVDEQRLMIASV